MQQYWDQIEEMFRDRVPGEYRRYFGPGVSETAMGALERHLGVSLPDDFKAFYSVHNGQGEGEIGLVFGLELLSVERIREEWDNWMSLGEDINADFAHAMSSEPEGHVRPLYLNRKWIPFTTDQTGTHLGLDFDPDVKGVSGQVIVFGRDQDRKKVLARSFRDYIHLFVEQLQSVDWTIDDEGEWEITNEPYRRHHYYDWLPGELRAPTETGGLA